jgi:hypothetical protein
MRTTVATASDINIRVERPDIEVDSQLRVPSTSQVPSVAEAAVPGLTNVDESRSASLSAEGSCSMLLTITTTRHPAADLGFLLEKHPGKVHEFELSAARD